MRGRQNRRGYFFLLDRLLRHPERSRRAAHCLLCLLFSFPAYSQLTYPDAGLWTTFTLEKPLTPKLSFVIDQEMRMRENYTMLNLFYTNLGLDIKPIPDLKVSVIYRSIEKWVYEYDYFSYRHRLMLDITYKRKFGWLIISNRGRIQAEVRDINTSRDGKFPEWFFRNKLEFKVDLEKRIFPFAYVESRHQLHDPRNPDDDWAWHRMRFCGGLEYKVNEYNAFGAYYLYQQEYNTVTPETMFNTGLYYYLKLK